MSIKKILLLLILLCFISGDFSLNALGKSVEVKYIFLFLYVYLKFLSKKPIGVIKPKLNRYGFFMYTTIMFFIALGVSISYSLDKYSAFSNFSKVSFILVLIIITIIEVRTFNTKEFFMFISNVLVVAGLIFTIPVVIEVLAGGNRGYFSLGGPNVTTRYIFFALIASFYLNSVTKRFIYIIPSFLFMAGIVFIGSRGGLVGAVVTLFLLWVVKNLFTKWKLPKYFYFKPVVVIYLGIAISAFLYLYEDIYRVFISRFINTTFRSDGIYSAGRDELYAVSIQMIKEKPIIGHGINGFDIRTNRLYPHNMALEFMNDIGVFGLLFFLLFLGYSIYLVFKYKKSEEFLFSGIPFYMIAVQMFSGSIYDFRFYFFWAISLIILSGKMNLVNQIKTQKAEVKTKRLTKKYRIVWS